MDPARALDSLYATAHWLLDQSRTNDALDVFRAMLLAGPSDQRSWLGAGLCHERLGQPTVAMQLYTLASSAAPPSARIELARARLYRSFDHEERASEAYLSAIELAHSGGEDDLANQIDAERKSP